MRVAGFNVGEMLVALGIVIFGLSYAWIGSTYQIGTVSRMGPGFVPVCVGIAIAGLGAAAVIENVRSPHDPGNLNLRAAFIILASIVVWGLLVRRFGIVPATTALVVVSSFAERRVRPVTTISLAIGLSFFAVFVFVHGFGLMVPIIDW